jgi:N-methylhydantoinase A
METKSFWIGVDTGGTFTDAIAVETGGMTHVTKVLSTPKDLSIGVMKAMERLAESAGMEIQSFLSKVQMIAHGTTATVNAMVQRKGARTGLITTQGFKDHFIMMKSGRGVGVPDVEKVRFSRAVKPKPLVPYSLTEEVRERIDYDGRIIVPLDEGDARRAIQGLLDKGVEAIAISLLWSFRNPVHEAFIRDLVREMAPQVSVTAGSDLVPVIGEYERTATTVINAYLGPILSRYVHELQGKLSGNGFRLPILLMQSDGGLILGNAAPQKAVTTMLSGLAAGVLGAKKIGQGLSLQNVITIDMGGTSLEVGMVYRGKPLINNLPLSPRLAPYEARWRNAAPTIDITAIGAGGGSIARVEGGVIKVGPISAGADPGPACYCLGGTEPTVTDAFVVLGYLSPYNFLGGRMVVEKEKAIQAIEEKIAKPLGVDLITAAYGIYQIVINQMADLIRKVSVERGHDPREFVLVAFGGCGPLHCGVLGAELKVAKVIVPGSGLATALSAYGLMVSDLRSSVAFTKPIAEPVDVKEVQTHLGRVSEKAIADVRAWGAPDEHILCSHSIDMRFKGQKFEVNVPISSKIEEIEDAEIIYNNFITTYERLYGQGTAHREAGIEMVTFRAEAIGKMTKPERSKQVADKAPLKVEPSSRREVFFEGKPHLDVAIYNGDQLYPNAHINGPAVVEYMGSATVVHPGQKVYVDDDLNLIFEFDTRDQR